MFTSTNTSYASTAAGRARRTMVLVAALLLASSAARAADNGQITTLRVIVYDHIGVPASALREAVRTVERIYREARVELTWAIYDPERLAAAIRNPGSDDTPIDNAVFVYLLTPAMSEARRIRPSVLGEALRGPQFAWIHIPRIEALARTRGEDFGLLLGHVVAHEMAHLLLPTSGHTAKGLMKESLDVPEVARGRVSFTADEANRIRERVSGQVTTLARDK